MYLLGGKKGTNMSFKGTAPGTSLDPYIVFNKCVNLYLHMYTIYNQWLFTLQYLIHFFQYFRNKSFLSLKTQVNSSMLYISLTISIHSPSVCVGGGVSCL